MSIAIEGVLILILAGIAALVIALAVKAVRGLRELRLPHAAVANTSMEQ